MPHIATWWCGQKAAREEVLSRLDEFAIEGAYGRGVPGFGKGPVLAGELSASERERLKTAIIGSRHRLCRPGTGAAVDHAGVGQRPHHAAPVRAAGVRGRNPRWLDHHARRLLPDRRSARCPRGIDGRRRAGGGRLGGVRQGGFDRHPAAGGRHRADQAHRRRGAEPRRRQSVLARPLSRARRGDAAAGAGARHAARCRQGFSDRAAGDGAGAAAAGDMGRDLADLAGAAGEGRGRGAAERGKVRLGAVAGALGAAHRDVAARTAVAGRLAGHHRNVGAAGAGSRRRRRRDHRRRTDAAGTRELRRPRAGKHEPRRRLALSRNGPPRRARHQHRAFRAPVRL